MAQLTHISANLDKISIILFWEILKSKNPLLLDQNYREDKKYSEEEKLYIVDIWEKVYDDFYKHRNDSKSRFTLQKNHDKLCLLFKINLITDTLSLLYEIDKVKDSLTAEQYAEFVFKVKLLFGKIDEKIKFNEFDLHKTAKGINLILQAYQTSYNRKHKEEEKEIDKEIENVYDIVVQVEQVLERSIPNIKEISVLQWLAYEKIAEKRIKQIKESKAKK